MSRQAAVRQGWRAARCRTRVYAQGLHADERRLLDEPAGALDVEIWRVCVGCLVADARSPAGAEEEPCALRQRAALFLEVPDVFDGQKIVRVLPTFGGFVHDDRGGDKVA